MGTLNRTDLSPASVEWFIEDSGRLLALEHPRAVHSNVLLIVDTRPPHGLVAVSHGAGHEQVPTRPCRISSDFYLGIQAVVDGKGECLGSSREEFADGLFSLEPSQTAPTTNRAAMPSGL